MSPTAVCAEMFNNVTLCPPHSWGYGKGIQGTRLYPPGSTHELGVIWWVVARSIARLSVTDFPNVPDGAAENLLSGDNHHCGTGLFDVLPLRAGGQAEAVVVLPLSEASPQALVSKSYQTEIRCQ